MTDPLILSIPLSIKRTTYIKVMDLGESMTIRSASPLLRISGSWSPRCCITIISRFSVTRALQLRDHCYKIPLHRRYRHRHVRQIMEIKRCRTEGYTVSILIMYVEKGKGKYSRGILIPLWQSFYAIIFKGNATYSSFNAERGNLISVTVHRLEL